MRRTQKLPPKGPNVLHSYQIERKLEDHGATKHYEARAIYDGNRLVTLVAHSKALIDTSFVAALERSHAFFRMFDHPNIIRLFDYFSDDQFVFEVFPHNSGGRLSYHLKERVRLRETHAGIILYQLLSALAQLHHQRIFYGGHFRSDDIYVYHFPDRVRLGGFNSARTFAELQGTDYDGDIISAAPETFTKSFELTPSSAVKLDVWGLGILFFTMITGQEPFPRDADLAKNVRHGTYTIPDTVSEPCADVIRAMLCVRTRDRPSPSAILEMPFLRVGQPKRAERRPTETETPVIGRRKRIAPSGSSPVLRTLRDGVGGTRKMRNAKGAAAYRSIPHTELFISGHEELPPLSKLC